MVNEPIICEASWTHTFIMKRLKSITCNLPGESHVVTLILVHSPRNTPRSKQEGCDLDVPQEYTGRTGQRVV